MMLLGCVLCGLFCGCSCCYHHKNCDSAGGQEKICSSTCKNKESAAKKNRKQIKSHEKREYTCEHAEEGVQSIPYVNSTDMIENHMTENYRAQLEQQWERQIFPPLT